MKAIDPRLHNGLPTAGAGEIVILGPFVEGDFLEELVIFNDGGQSSIRVDLAIQRVPDPVSTSFSSGFTLNDSAPLGPLVTTPFDGVSTFFHGVARVPVCFLFTGGRRFLAVRLTVAAAGSVSLWWKWRPRG